VSRVRAAAVFAATLVLSFILERHGAPGEAAFALQANTADPTRPSVVKVVAIDDTAYLELFGKQSPMNPVKIMEIVRAIATAGPAVIGVDIESVSPAYTSLPDTVDGVPVVWVRYTRCGVRGAEFATCPPGQRVPRPAAGRDDPGPLRAGFAELPEDGDGFTRRYSRFLGTSRGDLPTFSTAVLAMRGREIQFEPSGTTRLIRFHPIAEAEKAMTAQWVLGTVSQGGFARDNVLRGNIVLLGGTFTEGRDVRRTPVGDMAGVNVLAQVLETELDGGGPYSPGFWSYFVIQLLTGIVIAWIFRGRTHVRATVLSLGLCVAVTPVVSWLLFDTWSLWVYFLPGVSVWVLSQLFDVLKGHRGGPAPAATQPAAGVVTPAPAFAPADLAPAAGPVGVAGETAIAAVPISPAKSPASAPSSDAVPVPPAEPSEKPVAAPDAPLVRLAAEVSPNAAAGGAAMPDEGNEAPVSVAPIEAGASAPDASPNELAGAVGTGGGGELFMAVPPFLPIATPGPSPATVRAAEIRPPEETGAAGESRAPSNDRDTVGEPRGGGSTMFIAVPPFPPSASPEPGPRNDAGGGEDGEMPSVAASPSETPKSSGKRRRRAKRGRNRKSS